MDSIHAQPAPSETWFTFKIQEIIEGFEDEGPQLLIPYSDPSCFEDTFSLIWPTKAEAVSKMRVWIANHSDEIEGISEDANEAFSDAHYPDDDADAWWSALPESLKAEINAEMDKLTLVRLTIEPV